MPSVEPRTTEELLAELKSTGSELIAQFENARMVMQEMKLHDDTENEVVAQVVVAYRLLTDLRRNLYPLKDDLARLALNESTLDTLDAL